MTSVLYVASEAFPLVKTGGLGDVAGALPHALRRLGVDVHIMLPAYEGVIAALENANVHVTSGNPLKNIFSGGVSAQLRRAEMPRTGVPLWLVDCPSLYARDGNPYGASNGSEWSDNFLRFALLARAASLVAIDSNVSAWRPDIVHANDWHTGLLPYYLRTAPTGPRSVFTVHNMAYQGLYDPSVLAKVGVNDPQAVRHMEFWGKASFLKAGLVYADRVTTVSPTYAQEILEPADGMGLEGVLNGRMDDVAGILNGIDDAVWDPTRDPHLAQTYDATNITLKADNKAALRAALSLPALDTAPIIAVVSRLVEQKGIDVLLALLPALLNTGAQVVVLGSGDRDLEARLTAAAAANPTRVAVRLGYDEAFAHQVIAGADILFVPSRYEPCGLTQLYAQRYGTIPVVHRVGGLADTVTDEEDGFSFNAPTSTAAMTALVRACAYHRKRPRWRAMQRRAMRKRSGWDTCARRYVELYDDLLNGRSRDDHATDHHTSAKEGSYGTALAASR